MKDVSLLRSIFEPERFACRIDQGTSISFYKRVVPFTASVLRNLLHVGFPIDLGIYIVESLALRFWISSKKELTRNFPDNQYTQTRICNQ